MKKYLASASEANENVDETFRFSEKLKLCRETEESEEEMDRPLKSWDLWNMERRVDKVDGADEEGEKKPLRNCERVVGKFWREWMENGTGVYWWNEKGTNECTISTTFSTTQRCSVGPFEVPFLNKGNKYMSINMHI